jgi:hypothetical protein
MKEKNKMEKESKKAIKLNIVTESFGPERKRRHERLALLLQA